MSVAWSLDTIPQEVLESIAFKTATLDFLGPPSTLLPLLVTSRRINSRLSIASNHHLYARIFAFKFDIGPAVYQLGPDRITSHSLAHQLRQRCINLKRIRARLDSKVEKFSSRSSKSDTLYDLLFHAYLMMLENGGKNESQLRGYAGMDVWLREYWFDEHGASNAIASLKSDCWPPENRNTSLAMWLFWFLLKPDDYSVIGGSAWSPLDVLRIFALAAHKYNLTAPSWIDFVPMPQPTVHNHVVHYTESYHLSPPPLATPAILSFLKLSNRMSWSANCDVPLTPSEAFTRKTLTCEWECEWGRCLSLGQGDFDRILSDSFKPGILEGVWEGLFTYTEFTAYAALLAGASPGILQKCMVVRHQQTWKLREHHLIAPDPSQSDSGIEIETDNIEPLRAGDPLRSHLPQGIQIKEDRDGIEVREPGGKDILRYQRASVTLAQWKHESGNGRSVVLDIIVTGEGHSAWGQFNLIGRVRPCDGFISLSKEYVDGDRGRWLYRGYLVGNENGNLSGRWRDTLSSADALGYEGCFAMSRRR